MASTQENIGITEGDPETHTTASSLARDTPVRKRQKSTVWEHFEKLPIETDKDQRAKCKYCKGTFACNPITHGTSGLLKHLGRCVLNLNVASKRTQTLLSGSQLGSTKTLVHHAFNQEDCRKSVAKFIILDEMPFRVVEGEGFKRMMNMVEPRFQIPSRAMIIRDCLGLYTEEATKLKRYFKRTKVHVSLTIDTWTSCQNSNYMCLTAHWIDQEWNYQKRILNFCVVENHKGDTIALEIEKCLLAWSIENVFTITVDNASSNDNAVMKLKDVLRCWGGLVCNGDFLHLRCYAHILNLIVSDGLKEMNKCIEAIRNSIKYVRSSPSRFLKFKQLVEKMKIDSKSLLIMDCPTRWNSTYMMLDSAMKFSGVFERMESEDEDYKNYFTEKELVGPPEASNWQDAKEFAEFLKVFYNITLQFSGSLHANSNICFHQIVDVFLTLRRKANDHNVLVSSIARKMQMKYNKYWGSLETLNPLLVIAMILDPRYKMKYMKLALEEMFPELSQREIMISKVTNVLYRFYDFYSSNLDTCQAHSQIQIQGLSDLNNLTPFQRIMLENSPLIQRIVKESDMEFQTDQYGEVEKYLQAESVQLLDLDFDILVWWKCNASRYKVLSLIARDVLAMPVSTVSSESAFSTGGRVIDEFRSSLSPTMAEALVCAQNWLSPSTSKLKGLDSDNFNDTNIEELTIAIASILHEEEEQN